MRFNRYGALAALIILLFASTVHAGVVIGGTRVIFNGEKRSVNQRGESG